MTDPLALPRMIVLRPQPGASATAQALREAGHEPLVAPLFTVEPLAWTEVDPHDYDALLVGSANVFRHAGPGLAALRHLPVYAVGDKTAAMAMGLGFRVSATGRGGLAALLPALERDCHSRVLRLAGEDHVALPEHRLTIDTRVVYRARALAMDARLIEALTRPAVVLLHSARAAAHFAALCEQRRIDRARIALALFAPALADHIGSGWAAIAIAETSTDQALLHSATLLSHQLGSLQHDRMEPS